MEQFLKRVQMVVFLVVFTDDYEERGMQMKKYVCNVCGYVYDPAEGDPDNGVAAGTRYVLPRKRISRKNNDYIISQSRGDV